MRIIANSFHFIQIKGFPNQIVVNSVQVEKYFTQIKDN
jgi:hypothetical protein